MEMINEYFMRVNNVCGNIDESEIKILLDVLEKAYYQAKNIFIVGNGGSGATASHFCEDLAKGTLNNNIKKSGLRFKAFSLTDNVPFILALANDDGYESIFEQQLRTYAQDNDVVIAISGSGNSPNIINAVEYANKNNLISVGMTGFNGGKLREIAKYNVHVNIDDMGMTEGVHGLIVHYIVDCLRNKIARGYRYVESVSTVINDEVVNIVDS